jgi:hypothetical protein
MFVDSRLGAWTYVKNTALGDLDRYTRKLGQSPNCTSSRASIAALLSPSVCLKESSNSSVLALLLPIRTSPPIPRAIPTIIPNGVNLHRPSKRQTSRAGPRMAHARPANMSLRLRWIASRSSSIRSSSCSIRSTGSEAGSESDPNLFNHFKALPRRSSFGLLPKGQSAIPSRRK